MKTYDILVKMYKFYRDGGLFDLNANFSYSQEGEDAILWFLFKVINVQRGFYVDIGAHHPKRFSNTYIFYLRGWHGINVDASAEAISLFQKKRPKDINVLVGVGEKDANITYYIFDEPALNTFDASTAQEIVRNSPHKIIEEQLLEVWSLARVLDTYLPEGQKIDFLSVDVEGSDLAVLRSNDWSRFVPSYILVEYHSRHDQREGAHFDEVMDSEIVLYLKSKGYEPFAKTLNTLFFKLNVVQ